MEIQLITFLSNLAKAMHISGSNALELERHVHQLGNRFGVEAHCFALPTMLTITLETETQGQHSKLVRLPAYDFNMQRLIALKDLIRKLNSLHQLEQAEQQLLTIMQTDSHWKSWQIALCGLVLSSCIALLLGGALPEMLVAGTVGLLFVLLYLQLSRFSGLSHIMPVLLCTFAALCTYAISIIIPITSPFVVILASIVLLLPGFTITIAMIELATGNLLAGTGRLAGAFILLLMMAAGVAIGTKIGSEWFPYKTLNNLNKLPDWMVWPCVAMLGVTLMVFLQAPLKSLHIMIGACLLAFGVSVTVSGWFGSAAGAFTGAFSVAMAGQLYQRFSNEPGILIQIPGLITLVPGSVGFKGLHALMEQNNLAGISTITSMMITGAALVIGTLLANSLAFSRATREIAPTLSAEP
jgi:uncharacterized membrane protein YjjP (DUF1212 family)